MPEAEPRKQLSRAENAAYVIEQLRKLDCLPGPETRLMRMYDVLRRGYIACNDPDFLIALESDRDMVQLGFIFEELEPDGGKPEFLRAVKRCLHDSALPQDDLADSQGRDAQFELYLAAICQKARMLPVGYDESDVTCVVDGIPFSIEAKRIKSVRQASKRIKEAADQIARRKRPGIIALDITIGWNPDNSPVVVPFHNQMLDIITDVQGMQFFDQREDMIARCGAESGVLGVVAFDFRTRLIDNDWKQHRSAVWLDLSNDADNSRLYENFYDRFVAVVPNRDALAWES